MLKVKLFFTVGFLLTLIVHLDSSAEQRPKRFPVPRTYQAVAPIPIQSIDYKLPATVDPEILASAATEIWARAYLPIDFNTATGSFPLVVFLHGNHATCGSGINPRTDSDCTYTASGTCPNGFTVVPSHEGYSYVAAELARAGILVVSINANRGITCGRGTAADWGLNIARGNLVLKHLQLLQYWTQKGGAPSEFKNLDFFLSKIDFSRVGLVGHSRGGEGIRAALSLYSNSTQVWQQRIPGLKIRALYEIGAVDGQTQQLFNAENVAWNQLLPLCDGDVSDLAGRMPFERMLQEALTKVRSETLDLPKSLQIVWGANHNFFNTEWQTSDSSGCQGGAEHRPLFLSNDPTKLLSTSTEQQQIATESISVFFKNHLRIPLAEPLDPYFNETQAPAKTLAALTKIDRVSVPAMNSNRFYLVDDLSLSLPQTSRGFAYENVDPLITLLRQPSAPVSLLGITWKSSASGPTLDIPVTATDTVLDLSLYDFLVLRVGRPVSVLPLTQVTDFSVSLVTLDANLQMKVGPEISVSKWAEILGPPNEVQLVPTLKIPVSVLGDIKRVHSIRVRFGATLDSQINLGKIYFEARTGVIEPVVIPPVTPSQNPPTLPALTSGNQVTEKTVIQGTWDHSPLEVAGTASWISAEINYESYVISQNADKTVVEIRIRINGPFQIGNALPVLNIEGVLLPVVAIYPSQEFTNLTYSVALTELNQLPKFGKARVQIGFRNPLKTWVLPNFNGSLLSEALR